MKTSFKAFSIDLDSWEVAAQDMCGLRDAESYEANRTSSAEPCRHVKKDGAKSPSAATNAL